MSVLRIRGRALTEVVNNGFAMHVEEVERPGLGVAVGDTLSLRLTEDLVIYWIGTGDVGSGSGIEATIVVPLARAEVADTLDRIVNNASLESFLEQ